MQTVHLVQNILFGLIQKNKENIFKKLSEDIIELSHKIYKLINKLNPCIAIGLKETAEQFKKWTKGQVRVFEIPDNDNFLCDDKNLLNHPINQQE